ncbi:hypothetical protein NPIL_201601 [Nephila pilipes]|uniref:Uncharacterized protein n=1 Tax=Nephila pilipes TaxID=299642 RepID=A0A8X6M994_NEPPI|nr:hypothetical protein NPIL_201601 [Nephila pilipes]
MESQKTNKRCEIRSLTITVFRNAIFMVSLFIRSFKGYLNHYVCNRSLLQCGSQQGSSKNYLLPAATEKNITWRQTFGEKFSSSIRLATSLSPLPPDMGKRVVDSR